MKLSKRLLKIVKQHQDTADHQACILARRQADCPYLPDWFKDKHDAWYEGNIAANYAALDTILMAHNCYNGFWYKDVVSEQFKVKYQIQCYSLSGAQ